ncbi:MAG TPA: tetratricopeptide repeat protein [Flavobacteriaceae bacterium]|nr:tetratricopeptide repeat protein [Flavobacteriaceae bacterium]
MWNSILNLLQVGNNTQINNHITVYNAKIDTSIKRLEKDFHDGNIKQAIEDLESLLIENKSNSEIKYQLYIKKTSFLFSLRRYDEALNLLKYIEKEYEKFLDVSFDELKLISFSMNKDEESFLKLVEKIKVENPKYKNIEDFQLMYYLNTRNFTEAKEVFEKIDEELTKNRDIALMGGHLYSSLNDYLNTDKFYQIALSFDISFLDKASIYGFYGTDVINNYRYDLKNSIEYQENLHEYKKTIEILFTQEKYFEQTYIDILKNNYLFILLFLNKKENYIDFYEENSEIESIFVHHYFQYCQLKRLEINHNLVQEKILQNENELLMYYASLMRQKNNDAKIIMLFLEDKEEYIWKDKYIFLFYIQAKVNFSETTKDEFKNFLIENKYENIEYLLAYLTIEENEVLTKDIELLVEFANDEMFIAKRVFESLDILMKYGYKKEYIDLAITKQKEFPKVVKKALNLCYKDENLLFDEFEYFVDEIKGKEFYVISTIADIYAKFNAYNKSFEYFYLLYKEKSEDKDILLKILEISSRYYEKTNGVLDYKKEKEIYDILIANYSDLEIIELIFLFQYSLVVLKNTQQILPILNSRLLDSNIETLEQNVKIELSNLYTQTTIGMRKNYEQLFLYEDNICYVKDGETYLKGYDVIEENSQNFGFRIVAKNQYFTIKNGVEYQQKSIFHRIVGPFAFRVDNPNMIFMTLDTENENPLHEMFTFMQDISERKKKLFEEYSEENYYGLYPLATKSYANYFTLIPYLLNHDDYSLNSLKPSFMVNKKKILTLSSIVFLDHLGYLNQVLDLETIVIQQTTVNWLQKYIEDYTFTHRPQEFSYLDDEKPVFIPYTEEEDKKARAFKEELIILTTNILKCEIIDDTNENIPLVDTYELLAKDMGDQEYHALAYCIKNDYQIISENNIFEMLFETFGYNKLFISNSWSILVTILDETEIYLLQKKLFDFNYKYISNCPKIEKVIDGLNYADFKDICTDSLILNFKIWFEYGCLDGLIQDYINEYKVLYPKTSSPLESIFSVNMEYILKLIGYKNK